MNPKQFDQALSFAARGFRLVPQKRNKKALIDGWGKDKDNAAASADPEQIRKWAKQWPDCNFAVLCGVSGLCIADVDVKNGNKGMDSLIILRADYHLPDSMEVRTPSNGRHIYFKLPEKLKNGKSNFEVDLFPGIEWACGTTLITLPGSRRDNHGSTYELVIDGEIAELPEDLVNVLVAASKITRQSITPASTGEKITEGSRNNYLTSFAGRLRRQGLDEGVVLAALKAENSARCEPPLEESSVSSIAASVAQYEPENPIFLRRQSETGLSDRLIDLYGADLKYCEQWKQWLIWDNTCWKRDEILLIERLGRKVIERCYQAGISIQDDIRRGLWMSWVASVDRLTKIKAMVALTTSHPKVATHLTAFDTHPLLLNVQNGVVDLETGTLRTHRREDMFTRITGTPYDPQATCPLWLEFLNRVMAGRQHLVDYIRCLLGYCLTAMTDEQALFLFYGVGANGKSTLLQTVAHVFGDYAGGTRSETLLMRPYQSNSNDVARLAGRRLVHAVETDANKSLAVALIKQLTGGDSVTARFLYKEYFEYRPTYKIIMAVNHKPIIKQADWATWRRMKLLPFDVVIPDDDQDKELPDKLKKEAAGILAWCVSGAVDWCRNGLKYPEEVVVATAEYKDRMDVLLEFFGDCCDLKDRNAEEKSSEMFRAYKGWCEDNGEKASSQMKFSLMLEERGYRKEHRRDGWYWEGIRLKT